MEPYSEQPLASEPLTFPPPPAPPAANPLFFGRFGLRAGYGIAIWILGYIIFSAIGGLFAVGATGQAKQIMQARLQASASPGAPKPHIHIDFVPVLVTVQDGISFLGLFALAWILSVFIYRWRRLDDFEAHLELATPVPTPTKPD